MATVRMRCGNLFADINEKMVEDAIRGGYSFVGNTKKQEATEDTQKEIETPKQTQEPTKKPTKARVKK